MPRRPSAVPRKWTSVTASMASGLQPAQGDRGDLVFRLLRGRVDVVRHHAVDQELRVVERGEQEARAALGEHAGAALEHAVAALDLDAVIIFDAQLPG